MYDCKRSKYMVEPCIESEAKLHMKDMIDKQMKYDDMSLAR